MFKKLKLFLLIIPFLSSCNYGIVFETCVIASTTKLSDLYKTYGDDKITSLKNKFTNLSFDLTSSILTSDNISTENVVCSPISAINQLSMYAEISTGGTRDQILTTLNMDIDDLHVISTLLCNTFNNKQYIWNFNGTTSTISNLNLDNTLRINNNFKVKQQCIDNLKTYYNCTSHYIDFKNFNKESNKTINSYISELTHGNLKNYANYDENTQISIISNLYISDKRDLEGIFEGNLIKSEKEYVFNSPLKESRKQKFNVSETYIGKIYKNDLFSSFPIFTEQNIQITFIKPNENVEINEILHSDNLKDILNSNLYNGLFPEIGTRYLSQICFPDISTSLQSNIKNILVNKKNLTNIFNKNNYNFYNLSDEKIGLNCFLHNTSLKINNKGIDGANITGERTYTDPFENYTNIKETLLMDKPFIFIIDYKGFQIYSGVVNYI